MPQLEFRKVLLIFGRIMDIVPDFDLTENRERNNSYTVTFKDKTGAEISCTLINGPFIMELHIAKMHFENMKFDRWVHSFEYELEQAFLTNIKVTVDEDATTYRISIAS